MPYKVKGKCVYKKDSGKKVGCTKGSVKDYLAALHMHADESLDVTEDELKGTIRSVIDEHAKEYVWGVKGPQRVANKYSIKTLIKNILLEQGGAPAWRDVDEEAWQRLTMEPTQRTDIRPLIEAENLAKTIIGLFENPSQFNKGGLPPIPKNRDELEELVRYLAPIGNQLDKNTLELVVEYTIKKLEPLIQRLYGEETN